MGARRMGRGEELSGAEVEATLAAIERRVRARHGLPPDGLEGGEDGGLGALAEAMDAAHISAHFPILWDVPVVGRGIALSKRIVRLLLRWYINPIVDQQNDFNAATVRALNQLAVEQERLRLEIESLKGEGRGVRGEGSSDNAEQR